MAVIPSGIYESAPSPALTCEQAETMISRLLDDELSSPDAEILEAHLDGCENCQKTFNNWTDNSDELNAALAEAFPKPKRKSSAKLRVCKSSRKAIPVVRSRRNFWKPVGVASQFMAFAGLALYLAFFGQPASAPQAAAKPEAPMAVEIQKTEVKATPPDTAVVTPTAIPTPAPAELPEKLAASPAVVPTPAPAAPVAEAPANPFVPSEAVASVQAPVELPPPTIFATPVPRSSRPTEAGFAGLREPAPLEELKRVTLWFAARDTANPAASRGRAVVYGDVLSGRAVVRVFDARGMLRQEVAQADAEALLEGAARGPVLRFLAEVIKPDQAERIRRQ